MLYRYFLIILACASLLAGIQIPHFVDQYAKRLDAHLSEVTSNLRGFSAIAERHHGGSFEALLREHEASTSPSLREEAVPLREMYERRQMFLREQEALNTHLPGQAWHVALHGHPELVRATREQYNYTIPLSTDTLTAGAVFAGGVVLVVDLFSQLVGWLLAVRRRRWQARMF